MACINWHLPVTQICWCLHWRQWSICGFTNSLHQLLLLSVYCAQYLPELAMHQPELANLLQARDQRQTEKQRPLRYLVKLQLQLLGITEYLPCDIMGKRFVICMQMTAQPTQHP
jgi:hypothetical protein